jgi:hypothetical protein
VEDLDPASLRLLPLVYRNFERHGIAVEDYGRLKSAYRHAWAANQVLLQTGRRVLDRLRESGVDTIVLKGAALAVLDYEDVGVRPMVDLDVLVRPATADHAAEALESAGWQRLGSRSRSRIAVLHADELRGPGGEGVDLHWRTFMSREPEESLWGASVPLVLAGAPTRALCAADRLLHVCVHGLAPNTPRAIRWVADAAAVVARHEVDWERLVDQAQRREHSLTAARALRYLSRLLEIPVPAAALDELERGPHSTVEVAFHQAGMRTVTLREAVRWHWLRYRRVEPNLLRAALGFPRYLRLLLGYDARRPFLRHVARRLGAGARRIAPGHR